MAVDAVARAIAAGKVPVDAYEMAVAGGYTGTKEQFEEDMGNSGTNATNAANSATAAAASATAAANAAGNLAPAYSASATYAVGDHVLYDGGYYVCNTAITTAEAWTAAHWTAVKVGPEITNLTNALSDKVESAFVTDDLSGSPAGLTILEVDGDLQIYGTATQTRRICWLNGQAGSKTTGSAFDKTLDAGVYEIQADCTGGRTSFRIDATYSTFSDAFALCSDTNKNVTVTFTNPVMIGFYVNNTDPNWGTSENPSLLTFSAKRIIAKDVVARKDIDTLKQYDAVHSPAYQNEFAGILKGYPSFVFNSDKSITVTIPATGHGRAIYTGGIITDANGTLERTINVPKNNYFVYDSVNKDFAVRPLDDILVTDITCFFTTGSGGMVGNWLSYLAVDTANDTKDIVSKNELIDIPEYYNTNNYLSDKIDDIREIGFGLSINSTRFVFITDYHVPDNTGNSPALAKKIMRETGIKELYFNGDYNNKENTPIGGYDVLCSFLDDVKPLEYGNHIYYTTGNHEYNDPSGAESNLRIERPPIFQLFNAYDKNIVSINPDATNAYYVDYPDAKIRIYGIDCNYESEITPATRKYMFDSLLEVPEGYSVFVTSHVGKGSAGSETLSSRFEQIMECCAAMNDGTSATFSLGTPFGTVTYNFAGKARTFIGAITGHIHVDGYVIYDSRFPVIITECDTLDTTRNPNKVAGTVTEQAFDVVQIDVTNQRIYCTRIGDGSDRTFSFGTGAGLIT